MFAAHYLGLPDGGVSVEELLDLPGVDVLAAPDDHVLHPPHDPPVPVLLDHGGVPGVEPAVRGDHLETKLVLFMLYTCALTSSVFSLSSQ